MIISKSEGTIISFQWLDPQIGVEFETDTPRPHYFPFMPENMPRNGELNLGEWKGKKVRITVETIDDDSETSKAPSDKD